MPIRIILNNNCQLNQSYNYEWKTMLIRYNSSLISRIQIIGKQKNSIRKSPIGLKLAITIFLFTLDS
jgi:hypothetical protein